MNVRFTICSNNYLAHAITLAASVHEHYPDEPFFFGLVDKPLESNTDLPDYITVIPADAVEPDLQSLVRKFNIIELNTALKPRFFEYFFEHLNATQVIYLDPDLLLFSTMSSAERLLDRFSIVLTPHILSPIPLDDLRPDEPLFLNYGVYNLGFLALKNTGETGRMLAWWKERTYKLGFDRTSDGLFTDQLWMNIVPSLFTGVHVLDDPGYNMGPWNLHERFLSVVNNRYIVNKHEPLIFYHFSSFSPHVQRLHWEFTRFTWHQRPDLHAIHEQYRELLLSNHYDQYKNIPCFFIDQKTELLNEEKLIQMNIAKPAFRSLSRIQRGTSFLRRFARSAINRLTNATSQ